MTEAIRAELIGSNRCDAEGLSARGGSPVLALCRELVAAGFDPARPLEAYRGETLCLRVRSIGDGAGLTVTEATAAPYFSEWRPFPVEAMADVHLRCRQGSDQTAAGPSDHPLTTNSASSGFAA